MRDVVRRLAVSPMVWAFIGAQLAYLALSLLVDDAILLTLTNAMVFCTLVAFVGTYIRPTLQMLQVGRVDAADYVLLGIATWGISEAALRCYVTFMRVIQRPDLLIDSPVVAFFLFWMSLGIILLLTAPNAIKGKVPTRNWIKVGIAMGCGAALTVALLALGVRGGQ